MTEEEAKIAILALSSYLNEEGLSFIFMQVVAAAEDEGEYLSFNDLLNMLVEGYERYATFIEDVTPYLEDKGIKVAH